MKQYSSPQRHALLHAVHDCGSPLAVENADSPSGMTTFGSLVTYNCKSGYSPDRDGAAVCTMSGWINVPKCQGTGHTRIDIELFGYFFYFIFREKDHRRTLGN